jgi:hypothetical protein
MDFSILSGSVRHIPRVGYRTRNQRLAEPLLGMIVVYDDLHGRSLYLSYGAYPSCRVLYAWLYSTVFLAMHYFTA